MIEEAPKIAKRKRIDQELEFNLRDHGDRKLLARAIVDEFSFGYRYKKNGRRRRHTLCLEVMMYDPLPVRQVAELMGVRFRRHFRDAEDGTPVPYWETRADGYRAFEILRLVRPYLVGQKAFQADIALKTQDRFPRRRQTSACANTRREYSKKIGPRDWKGADIATSRDLSDLTNMTTTCGLTSGIGTSPGRTHTLWPAEVRCSLWQFNPFVRGVDSNRRNTTTEAFHST